MPGTPPVEHRHGRMAGPAQHPPGAHRHCAKTVVIDNDLLVDADAPGADFFGEILRVGQGVAARRFGDRRGQVFIQMDVTRAGNVILQIGLTPGIGIGQGEAAIKHDPVRVIQMLSQIFSANDSVYEHMSVE